MVNQKYLDIPTRKDITLFALIESVAPTSPRHEIRGLQSNLRQGFGN